MLISSNKPFQYNFAQNEHCDIFPLVTYIRNALLGDLHISMNRRNNYSLKILFKCSFGLIIVGFIQTCKTVNLPFKHAVEDLLFAVE